MVELQIKKWNAHLNMILSSALYYADKNKIQIKFICNPELNIPLNTCLIFAEGRTAFLDYNDGTQIYPVGLEFDKYFKRSLLPKDASGKILPLGLHFNYSYRLSNLIFEKGFASKQNKIEVIRSWDFLRLTSMSHFEMRIKTVFESLETKSDFVIFYTRLWEPHNKLASHKQEERNTINETRIKIVKELRKIPNTFSGIVADQYSKQICPSLLISKNEATKKQYFKLLRQSGIGIANEGLGGTPGWKIGEYVAMGKSIITNKIETVVPNFTAENNYCLLKNVEDLPHVIQSLRKDAVYIQQGKNNIYYANSHLHPLAYFRNILEKL